MKILKFLIKKNGFYDRENLVSLSEKTFRSIFICKLYRAYLKTFYRRKKEKIILRKEIHPMERISEHLGHINFFSRIKFKFIKKYGK